MYSQYTTGELQRDQIFDIINKLDFNSIRELCKSNNYYTQICKEERFKNIVQRKYKEHQNKIDQGINNFNNILKSIYRSTTINYYIDQNHSIHFYTRITRARSTGIRSLEIYDIIEQGKNISLNEYILAKLFLLAAKINMNDLFQLSRTKLIELIATEQDKEAKELGIKTKLTKEGRIRGMQQVPEEFYNYQSNIDYFLERYNFKTFKQQNNLQIIFYEPSSEQIEFIIRNIYNIYSNPKITIQ